jgi:hypothetical protein
MSTIIIMVVAVLYLGTGIDFLIKQQIGLGLTFIFYSLSNVGLFLTAKGI